MNRKPSRRTWVGGHIHRTEAGTDLFIIERQINGRRYHVSTRAHSLEAAMAQLARFESNPNGYQPRGEPGEPLLLEESFTNDFFTYLTKKKGCTTKYARECCYCITDLAADLGDDADIRKLTLRELREAIAKRSGQKRRIIATKSFFSWLRKERCLLDRTNDPAMDLVVPVSTPAQWKKRKAVPIENVEKAAQQLPEPYRDVLIFVAALGCHVTELERFARHHERSEFFRVDKDGVLAVVGFHHKGGKPVRNALADPQVVDAAERIWARRGVPRHLNAALRAACLKAGIEPFTFGVLRHSVATWGNAAGIPDEEMGRHLHHEGTKTLRRHYIFEEIPKPVNVPRLRLVR